MNLIQWNVFSSFELKNDWLHDNCGRCARKSYCSAYDDLEGGTGMDELEDTTRAITNLQDHRVTGRDRPKRCPGWLTASGVRFLKAVMDGTYTPYMEDDDDSEMDR